MAKSNVLFRIYVWHYTPDDTWVAEGKWWRESDDKDESKKNVQGTIGHVRFFHENLSDAIDEIIEVAREMNIVIKDDLRLDYSEKYAYWDDEDNGEPNPFPMPENFEEIIEAEREKRNWKS